MLRLQSGFPGLKVLPHQISSPRMGLCPLLPTALLLRTLLTCLTTTIRTPLMAVTPFSPHQVEHICTQESPILSMGCLATSTRRLPMPNTTNQRTAAHSGRMELSLRHHAPPLFSSDPCHSVALCLSWYPLRNRPVRSSSRVKSNSPALSKWTELDDSIIQVQDLHFFIFKVRVFYVKY